MAAKQSTYVYAILAALALSSCSTLKDDVEKYQTYSCIGLAEEIGRWEQKLESAELDGGVAVLGQIFGDKEEREEAELDETIAEFDEDDAHEHLRELRRIQAQKQCPRN